MPDDIQPDYALIDRAGAASFLFYPRRDRSPGPEGSVDYRIVVDGDIELGARHYTRDPAAPTILYFHGNGEIVSDHDDIAPLYHETGANLLVVDFRGYGASSGSPTFAALVDDVPAIVAAFHRLLDESGHRAARFIMGRSLGSHPALEIAANHAERFSGLVIESGAANLRRLLTMLGLSPGEGPGQALVEAHERKIRSIQLPVLILHGEYDELIPVEHAAELYDLLDATDRTLEVIPGAGHNDILWRGQDQYFDAIAHFIANR